MKKSLALLFSVGALVVFVSAAVAQTEHGSGHDMHGTTGQVGKAGHHEMMKNHMAAMKAQMGKAGHEMMKNHMGQTGHAMKNHAGQAGHESHGGKTAQE